MNLKVKKKLYLKTTWSRNNAEIHFSITPFAIIKHCLKTFANFKAKVKKNL